MTSQRNTVQAREWFDAISRGDLSKVDDLFASNYVLHLGAAPEAPPGRESIRQLIASFRTAFPDLRVNVDDTVTEGAKVVVRWSATGTHEGPLMGMPRTGKRAHWTGVSFLRFEGEQIAEDWVHMDTLAMLQQLGLVPV